MAEVSKKSMLIQKAISSFNDAATRYTDSWYDMTAHKEEMKLCSRILKEQNIDVKPLDWDNNET